MVLRRRAVLGSLVVAVVLVAAAVIGWPHLQRYVGAAPPKQITEPLGVTLPTDAGAKVLGIAHNAGNNLGTLKAAIRAGADVVEIDVISSRGRLAAGREQEPFPGLARAIFRGPSVATAMRAAGGVPVKLDLKQQDHAFLQKVVTFLASRGHAKVMVVSPDPASVILLHRRFPDLMVVYSASSPEALQRLRSDPELASAVGGISLFQGLVDPDLVAWAHSNTLQVLAWTVDDGPRVDQLVRLGVDGITSANLDVLRALGSGG